MGRAIGPAGDLNPSVTASRTHQWKPASFPVPFAIEHTSHTNSPPFAFLLLSPFDSLSRHRPLSPIFIRYRSLSICKFLIRLSYSIRSRIGVWNAGKGGSLLSKAAFRLRSITFAGGFFLFGCSALFDE